MLLLSRHFQANDQLKRYDNLTNQCKTISPQQDLNSFVKIMQPESPPKVPKKSYAAPTNEADEVSLGTVIVCASHLDLIDFNI